MKIYIDADSCSVKSETFKVALRYKIVVYVVANSYIKVPLSQYIRLEVVSDKFDAADDWIIEKIEENDILITSDILLAEKAVQKKARVLGQKGNELDEENIGSALAAREISGHLRNLGAQGTGPSAFLKSDRSRFLGKLDQIIQSLKKS